MARNPVIRELLDRIEPPSAHGVAPDGTRVDYDGPQSNPTSDFASTERPSKSSNPHGGFDQNRGKGVGGPIASPIHGVVRGTGGPYGHIVIDEVDPVTHQYTGYTYEILHTQSQFVKEGNKVSAGDPIGLEGGVGAGIDKDTQQPILGASHAHSKLFFGTDPTPLNPLRHLYEYTHPGEQVPSLSELEPYSVPPKKGPRPDPRLSSNPWLSSDAPLGGQGPSAPSTQPPGPAQQRTSPPQATQPRTNPPPSAPISPNGSGQQSGPGSQPTWSFSPETPASLNPVADRSGTWGSVPLPGGTSTSDNPANFADRFGNWGTSPAGVLGNLRNLVPQVAPGPGKRSEMEDDAPVRVLSRANPSPPTPTSNDAPPLAPPASPALGIFSGQPMPDHAVWPSIFATGDRPSPDDDDLYQRWRRWLDA